ncbi:hypothetical protein GJ744_010413 [Endocarpon pusillum]|uniref:Uncharacterized protein n=1 Tax=Endocarpon pusillum TaxID=364733 RepID=A0A8H7AGJ8_9EURO|nr:hypothetical protein GJ744_010413 [Endocarpon pusillum]
MSKGPNSLTSGTLFFWLDCEGLWISIIGSGVVSTTSQVLKGKDVDEAFHFSAAASATKEYEDFCCQHPWAQDIAERVGMKMIYWTALRMGMYRHSYRPLYASN